MQPIVCESSALTKAHSHLQENTSEFFFGVDSQQLDSRKRVEDDETGYASPGDDRHQPDEVPGQALPTGPVPPQNVDGDGTPDPSGPVDWDGVEGVVNLEPEEDVLDHHEDGARHGAHDDRAPRCVQVAAGA